MTARPSLRRARTIGLGLGVLALLCVGVVGVWRPWAVSPQTVPVAAAAAPLALAPLALPERPRVLVFGDSWTYGSAASDPSLGYAYVLADALGAETIVNGVRGSGYLKPGIDGPTFGERVALLDPTLRPDLVIVQGSINDRRMGAKGYDAAVGAAWDALAATYPDATIVVLGPAPHKLPIGKATARIDRDLARLAASRGWHYISPIAETWITPDNYATVIDAGLGRFHPSTDGHRYLAERLTEDLRRLASESPVLAGESEEAVQR